MWASMMMILFTVVVGGAGGVAVDSPSWYEDGKPDNDCGYMAKKLHKCDNKVDVSGVSACDACASTCGGEDACGGGGGDGDDPYVCGEDEHVARIITGTVDLWGCRPCPEGTTNAAGDVVSGGYTRCDGPRAEEDLQGGLVHNYMGGHGSTPLGPDPAHDGGTASVCRRRRRRARSRIPSGRSGATRTRS